MCVRREGRSACRVFADGRDNGTTHPDPVGRPVRARERRLTWSGRTDKTTEFFPRSVVSFRGQVVRDRAGLNCRKKPAFFANPRGGAFVKYLPPAGRNSWPPDFASLPTPERHFPQTYWRARDPPAAECRVSVAGRPDLRRFRDRHVRLVGCVNEKPMRPPKIAPTSPGGVAPASSRHHSVRDPPKNAFWFSGRFPHPPSQFAFDSTAAIKNNPSLRAPNVSVPRWPHARNAPTTCDGACHRNRCEPIVPNRYDYGRTSVCERRKSRGLDAKCSACRINVVRPNHVPCGCVFCTRGMIPEFETRFSVSEHGGKAARVEGALLDYVTGSGAAQRTDASNHRRFPPPLQDRLFTRL